MLNGAGKTAFCAVFKVKEGRDEERPVAGWDDDGYALTVDWKAGCLVRAVDQVGFSHVDDDPVKYSEVCAVLPAPQGWHLVTGDGTQPIIGWSINGFGCGDPLVVDPDGNLIVANTSAAKAYAPGQRPKG